MKPRVLLFDIGGVLVDFIGPAGLQGLLDGRHRLDELEQMWPDSPSLQRYELGLIDEQTFIGEFTREWKIELSPPAFIEAFSSWARAPLPGALSLLDDLKGTAILACLTNMNASYWSRIRDEMGFGTRFEHCYASQETGLLKPDPAAYRQVLDDLECQPAELWFFDDTLKNVDAARAIGMRAFHIRGTAELKSCLHRELGKASPWRPATDTAECSGLTDD